jgi:hypothetical protein
MDKRNPKTFRRPGQSRQSVARKEAMHIVKSGDDDMLTPSREDGRLVCQNFEPRSRDRGNRGIDCEDRRWRSLPDSQTNSAGPVEAAVAHVGARECRLATIHPIQQRAAGNCASSGRQSDAYR